MRTDMPEPAERLPIAHAPISVVLAVRNNESKIEGPIQAWAAYLASLGRDHEIILVEDGGDDRAGLLADELAGKIPRLKVIHHAQAPGVGAGLRSGLAAARFPLFFYTDCSSAYEPQDPSKLLDLMDHVDLAIGIRIWQQDRPRRSLGDWCFRLLLRFIFGLRLRDVDCSFKLFRKSVFARIPIQSNGPFVHAEILAKANFLGCMMAEVDIRYSPVAEPGLDAAGRRQRWREAIQILRHPDFGPAELPAES